MVRINLLPQEILERRRYEVFYPYILIVGAVLLGVVVLSWSGLQLLVSQRVGQVQQSQEVAKKMDEQAKMLAVFEEQRAALTTRQNLVKQALGGRLDVGRIMEEISLVLPDPLWVSSITINQDSGADLKGQAPYANQTKLSEGYKSIAWGLVRLNSLDSLYDVWLTSAADSSPTVSFEITAKISTQTAPPSGVPTLTGQ